MISDMLFLLKLIVAFVPFFLFVLLSSKANVKKKIRSRQFPMPIVALLYSVVLFALLSKLSSLCLSLAEKVAALFERIGLQTIGQRIMDFYTNQGILLQLLLFNTLAMVLFILVKRMITLAIKGSRIRPTSWVGSIVGLFYAYDEAEDTWYIKAHLGQARSFLKVAYYAVCVLSAVAMLVSCVLCRRHLISQPFYPVFAVIVIGELMFFVDGLRKEEDKQNLTVSTDRSRLVAVYPLLRKPLRTLFGDKLSSEGTSINHAASNGGSIEEILEDIENEDHHLGANYAAFLRKKMDGGFRVNADYIRCGYDLAAGKSLLFNTPFYYKLVPYAFYAMNRHLLTGGKVLIVAGRQGTSEDLLQWCRSGMLEVSNVPELWKTSELTGAAYEEEDMPDIGIISRSSVHDLDVHRANLAFLRKVSFVVIVEPSRLITTAQIGLHLLIKCCGGDRKITYCSVDRNCDGLVDALSHILMTHITEVSATEYPHGTSSYMCWTADSDYIQHRIVPGVSRYLGMGTEFSFVALKNQVKRTIWYGGEVYPVLDAHWIAKQYYYDLADYAKLPTTQEVFDKYFLASFNMCNEKTDNYSFITVEDERHNLFETKRNYATIAEQQGFVNVISTEYMLREYMTENNGLFNADAKAIPYITADYARTIRNCVLSLCLRLCIEGVTEQELNRELMLLGIDTADAAGSLWNEICSFFCGDEDCRLDKNGNRIISVSLSQNATIEFLKDQTIRFERRYSVEKGKFESVYSIADEKFSTIILNDLQSASYVAEQEGRDYYLGSELKGHIYQKYLPGQFVTLNGKYYEMVTVAAGNRILVRRASEHINGRLSYRQVRKYVIEKIENSQSMGALKTVNGVDIFYQNADFYVETPAYWRLSAYNDFRKGALVTINGVPTRQYYNKQMLRLDFSKIGEAFTDDVRMTLTALMNEVFVTLFSDTQPYIVAVTPGEFDVPITYSLQVNQPPMSDDKCIYIIEDSQLDIGLLVAVERNLNRIFQIISDYLSWNEEKITDSKAEKVPDEKEPVPTVTDAVAAGEEEKARKKKEKKCIFKRIIAWIKSHLPHKKKKAAAAEDLTEQSPPAAEEDELSAPEDSALTADEIPPEETDTDDAAGADEIESDEAEKDDEVAAEAEDDAITEPDEEDPTSEEPAQNGEAADEDAPSAEGEAAVEAEEIEVNEDE